MFENARRSTTTNSRSSTTTVCNAQQQEHQRAKIHAFEEFDRKGKGGFSFNELEEVLCSLDMDCTPEERRALFNYLDADGNGVIDFQEFDDWYSSAVEDVRSSSENFRNLLMSRRTVNQFDTTPVSDDVLRRAIECAIAAPNRSGSEPWNFVKIGPTTVQKLQELNARVVMAGGDKVLKKQQSAPLLPEQWTEIPGWCVVTSKRSPDDPDTELKDYRSTSCAMQNFMLSMWSEGVGSKWTEGPTQKTQQFADIVGIDTTKEKVVGIIWYGFSKHTTDDNLDPKQQRKKGVEDLLRFLP